MRRNADMLCAGWLLISSYYRVHENFTFMTSGNEGEYAESDKRGKITQAKDDSPNCVSGV